MVAQAGSDGMIDDLDPPSWLDEFEDAQREIGDDPKPGRMWGLSNIVTPDDVVFAGSAEMGKRCVAAGWPQVVALEPPNVPNLKRRVERMLAVLQDETICDKLDPVTRFRIAFGTGDEDRRIAEEIARRLGKHRCLQVDWPTKRGIAAVNEALHDAKPYPLKGIQVVNPDELLLRRQRPQTPTMTTGCMATDDAMALPTEGRVIVVTGIPNMGKSPWVTHIAAHTALKHDRRWAIFSPEMSPWTDLADLVMQAVMGKSIRTDDRQFNRGQASDGDLDKFGWFVRERFCFIEFEDEDGAGDDTSDYRGPTLGWVLERAQEAVLRRGVTDLVIDPWNEVDAERPEGMSEPQWLGRCIQRLDRFAKRYGCNVWVVAHPNVMRAAKQGEPAPMPGIYDVSGGSMWANKAAIMLCVHRKGEATEIHTLKAKFPRWGRRNAFGTIHYDGWSGRYFDTATFGQETF